jgi:hypothetical protein
MPIVVPIVADTSGLVRGLSKGQSGLRRFGKIAAGVAGAAALGGLVATVKVGIDEFMEAQKVLAQTGAVLKSTGGVAKVTSKDITTLSSSIMRMTGIDDEAVQAGQNLLLTFTKIRNETGKGNDIFNQATLAMTDLSVAMGKDLNSSAILVGKALNDPVKGVGALSKAGVQFTADQKEMIKGMVESGDVMGAQKMILKELETQFAGSAEAAGKTLSGQLNILKQTFSNLAGELVSKFMPSVARATQKLLDFVVEFAARPTFIGKVSFIIDSIKDSVGNSYDSLRQWWTESKATVGPTGVVRVQLSGAAEVRKGFRELRELAATNGTNAGADFANSFFERGIGGNFSALFKGIGGVIVGIFRFTGIEAGLTFTGSFVNEVIRVLYNRRDEIVDGVKGIFSGIDFSQLGKDVLKGTVQGPTKDARKLMRRQFQIIINDPIKEAIASARDSLAGLGSSLGEMLSRITGATSPEAKRAAEIRKQQKAEQKARELGVLRDALATAETDEDRRKAQQDLDDYLLEQEAQRLEESVAARQESDSLAIDNLIEEFNRGLIGPETFSARLDGIIGANRGTELGIAFAGGFSSALGALTTTVQSIVAGAAGVQAPTGTGVAAAQSGVQQEKEARYNEAVRDYNARRAERLKRAEDARRANDGRISPGERAEIHRIMAAWDAQPGNKKPQRAAFGLAMGGILKQPTFVAGEAGREAVIPLESSSAMKILRDAIGGGGGSTVVYNLVVNAGLGTDPDDLGRTIVESIKRYEKRNGAVFQGPIVTTLANAAGKTSTASAATDFNRAKTLRSG